MSFVFIPLCCLITTGSGCNFTEYLQHHHKESESPNHRLFDQLPQAITTNGGGNYYIESSDDSGKGTIQTKIFEFCMFRFNVQLHVWNNYCIIV